MKQHDEFEELLGEALAEFREKEPRAGIEGRVMATVDSVARTPKLGWWKWLAVAAAALVVIALWVARPKPPAPVVRNQESPVVRPKQAPQTAEKHEQHVAPRSLVRRPVQVATVRPRSPQRASRPVTSVAIVSAPLPMSPQERALMAMAQGAAVPLRQQMEEQRQQGPLPEIPEIKIKPIQGAEDGGEQ